VGPFLLKLSSSFGQAAGASGAVEIKDIRTQLILRGIKPLACWERGNPGDLCCCISAIGLWGLSSYNVSDTNDVEKGWGHRAPCLVIGSSGQLLHLGDIERFGNFYHDVGFDNLGRGKSLIVQRWFEWLRVLGPGSEPFYQTWVERVYFD